MYKKYIKRQFDIFFSLIFILFLSPFILILILLLYLEDGKPIFFKQQRIGKDGAIFILYKFRTMPINTQNVESADAADIKIKTCGRLLRRFNLDEIPQLINIFFGEMSFVGPRPSLTSQNELNELRKKNNISSIKPGLTGNAQINAFDNMSNEQKVEFDLYYFKNISLFLDLYIILKTFRYLLHRPPVY